MNISCDTNEVNEYSRSKEKIPLTFDHKGNSKPVAIPVLSVTRETEQPPTPYS